MMNPDDKFKKAMEEAGLKPPNKPILWNGKVQRFSAPGEEGRPGKKSSWYVGFPDQRGGVFGCFRSGVDEVTWQDSKDMERDLSAEQVRQHRREIRERQKEREREKQEEYERIAALCNKRWEKAEEPDLDHPYLKAKGITDPVGIRQQGNLILVPCKSPDHANQLRSLQTIDVDGTKLFVEGGQVQGTKATLNTGRLKPDGRLYVCEGYATAWSIHHITGDPVVICFSTANMEPVVSGLVDRWRTRYPQLEIVIAADNDRWSKIRRGDEWIPNPGVVKAREVATKHGVSVVVPDFKDLTGKPTDFNDLHQMEGVAAVKQWLDVGVTEYATVEPEPEGKKPTPVAAPSDPEWQQRAPFRVLGYNQGTYYFLPKGSGEVSAFPPNNLERSSYLYTLAPNSYWETYFPANNGVSWRTISDSLIQACHRKGVFTTDKLRGRGCWPEEDPEGEVATLIHLGDRMIAPGHKQWVAPESYKSPTEYHYERGGRMRGPDLDNPLSAQEASEILETFRMLLWSDPGSGDLLAGWTALAPLCGALDWRPHVWLVGERGSGKTTVARDMVVPLLAGSALYVHSETTEAGIRGDLKADARPVVFDEAEEGEGVGTRIQRVIALARAASSESDARTLKGTPTGNSLQFRIRSMFCFASIGGAVKEESDRSRVALLQLKGASQVDARERDAHWKRFQPKLHRINEDLGRRLMARNLKLLREGVLSDTVDVFREAAGSVLGDQRKGDQYGTLLAGSWILSSDSPPSRDVARELVGSAELDTYQEDQRPEGLKLLHRILQYRERMTTKKGNDTITVGELVDGARGDPGMEAYLSMEECQRILGQMGIRVEDKAGQETLVVANQSEFLSKALHDTPYSRSVRTVLRGLPGAEPSAYPKRFSAGIRSRATEIPMDILEAHTNGKYES